MDTFERLQPQQCWITALVAYSFQQVVRVEGFRQLEQPPGLSEPGVVRFGRDGMLAQTIRDEILYGGSTTALSAVTVKRTKRFRSDRPSNSDPLTCWKPYSG